MYDMAVNGPPGETEFYLDYRQVEEDQYHDIACSITRRVLEVSPRQVSEIRLMGTVLVLQGVDDEALETLSEAGYTVTDKQLDGRVASSKAVIEAVLSLYAPGLHHAHFFDSDGYGIAARYDDMLQHYWLPASNMQEVRAELDSEVSTALVQKDEYAKQIDERQSESTDS